MEPQEEHNAQIDDIQCSHLEDPLDVLKREHDDVDAEIPRVARVDPIAGELTPSISDENMKPFGKVVDVLHNDEVLKLIRCRSLDKLNGNVFILFIIQATLIVAKTINYPRICKTTKRTQTREKRSEYAGFNTEPNNFNGFSTENNQDLLFDAYNRPMDVSLQSYATDINNNNKIVLQNGQDNNEENKWELNSDDNSMITSKITDEEPDNDCIDIEDLKENAANFNNGLRTIVFIPSSTKPADINYENEDFRHTTYTSNYYNPVSYVNGNGNNEKTEESTEKTDITNMREVREHLLDHLLEYFNNIIKEEQRYMVTKINFNKDKMKLENKLRNYYSPEHVDQLIYKNNLDTNDTYNFNDNNDTVSDIVNKLNVKDLAEKKTKIDEEIKNNANPTLDLDSRKAIKDKPDTENNTNIINSNEHNNIYEDIELPTKINNFKQNADLEVNIQNSSTTAAETITTETPNSDRATEKPNINEKNGNKSTEIFKNQSKNDITSNSTNDTKPQDIITSVMKENRNNSANIKSIAEDYTNIINEKRKNKQNNEQRSIDINNRTIRIKKTISGPAKSKLDDILSSDDDLSTGICKKNIILQFNINI